MCLVILVALFAPRVAFALMWIFGDSVDAAFGSWVWPLLLLIFLPWTGIVYTLAWTPLIGLEWWEFVLVGLAVAIDIGSWMSRAAKNRYA